MKIVHILWTLGRAGAERMVLDVSRHMKSEGHDVFVLAAGGGGDMRKDFEDAGISVFVMDSMSRMKRGRLIKHISKKLEEINPDIVHTHLGGDVWGGKAVKRLHGIPWIMTAHSHEDDIPFIQRFGRTWAYAHADHIVAVSKSVADAVTRRYRLSQERLSIIPVGLDMVRFKQRDPHLPGDIPVIISVGRLVPEKGHETLLRALAPIEQPYLLRLVGHGPEFLKLQRLAESLGILPRVHFEGVVKDVAPFLRESDLFCFPSWHEGQGVALYEAAAAQVPIIASDLTAFRERFDESHMAFVKSDDVEGWTRAIRSALQNYGQALERAKRASEEITLHYTKEAMGEAYLVQYKRLIKKRQSPGS